MTPSYHDVIVYINNEPHRVAGNYAYELTCTKSAGWRLFWRPIGSVKAQLLGGEFDGGAFRIEVNGIVVCDNAQEAEEGALPPTGGWNGMVDKP